MAADVSAKFGPLPPTLLDPAAASASLILTQLRITIIPIISNDIFHILIIALPDSCLFYIKGISVFFYEVIGILGAYFLLLKNVHKVSP